MVLPLSISEDDAEALLAGSGSVKAEFAEIAAALDVLRSIGERELSTDFSHLIGAAIVESKLTPIEDYANSQLIIASDWSDRVGRWVVLGAAALFVLIVGSTGLAYAADRAGPGDPLYGLDRMLESIGIGNGGASERLEEAGAVVAGGEDETGEVADTSESPNVPPEHDAPEDPVIDIGDDHEDSADDDQASSSPAPEYQEDDDATSGERHEGNDNSDDLEDPRGDEAGTDTADSAAAAGEEKRSDGDQSDDPQIDPAEDDGSTTPTEDPEKPEESDVADPTQDPSDPADDDYEDDDEDDDGDEDGDEDGDDDGDDDVDWGSGVTGTR